MMGMSQEQLGELLGVTSQQIQKYERGINRIGSARLFSASKLLDTSIGWFFETLDDDRSGPWIKNELSAVNGLSETGLGFVHQHNGPDASAAKNAVDHRETLDFVKMFHRIRSPAVRQRLYELAKALAALPDGCSGGR